jgi:hypothetical protein
MMPHIPLVPKIPDIDVDFPAPRKPLTGDWIRDILEGIAATFNQINSEQEKPLPYVLVVDSLTNTEECNDESSDSTSP